eukprot:2156844-Pleurochrysis_carterae.AAC.2
MWEVVVGERDVVVGGGGDLFVVAVTSMCLDIGVRDVDEAVREGGSWDEVVCMGMVEGVVASGCMCLRVCIDEGEIVGVGTRGASMSVCGGAGLSLCMSLDLAVGMGQVLGMYLCEGMGVGSWLCVCAGKRWGEGIGFGLAECMCVGGGVSEGLGVK